jgi:small subunit ribosomal protein S17
MAEKSEKVGVVVSDAMQKSCVVAVEWQVRHGLYGKTERRTSKFMVHDEKNEAKTGDMVAIVETRPDEPPQAVGAHAGRAARPSRSSGSRGSGRWSRGWQCAPPGPLQTHQTTEMQS